MGSRLLYPKQKKRRIPKAAPAWGKNPISQERMTIATVPKKPKIESEVIFFSFPPPPSSFFSRDLHHKKAAVGRRKSVTSKKSEKTLDLTRKDHYKIWLSQPLYRIPHQGLEKLSRQNFNPYPHLDRFIPSKKTYQPTLPKCRPQPDLQSIFPFASPGPNPCLVVPCICTSLQRALPTLYLYTTRSTKQWEAGRLDHPAATPAKGNSGIENWFFLPFILGKSNDCSRMSNTSNDLFRFEL